MTKTPMMALGALLVAAVVPSPMWNATLTATDGSSIGGTATVSGSPVSTLKADSTLPPVTTSMTASVSVNGAKPRTSLAWFVHEGGCGEPGPVVGQESGYSNLTIDERGTGRATASLSVGLTEGKSYSVQVHAGASKATPVAACGGLTPGTRQTPDQ